MATSSPAPVFISGATSCPGRALIKDLLTDGVPVHAGTRNPDEARARHPGPRWMFLDLTYSSGVEGALEGCKALVYMARPDRQVDDPAAQARAAATRMRQEAERAGVERIVALSCMLPEGGQAGALRSAALAGVEALRGGEIPVVELRVDLIIGHGSPAWRVVRDLACRLPVMPQPGWARAVTSPVAAQDVVVGLRHALEMPLTGHGIYDLAGPELLTGAELLERVCALRDTRQLLVPIPALGPALSNAWAQLATQLSSVQVQGLTEALAEAPALTNASIWPTMDAYQRLSVDEAMRRTLHNESEAAGRHTRLLEAALRRLYLPTRAG